MEPQGASSDALRDDAIDWFTFYSLFSNVRHPCALHEAGPDPRLTHIASAGARGCSEPQHPRHPPSLPRGHVTLVLDTSGAAHYSWRL